MNVDGALDRLGALVQGLSGRVRTLVTIGLVALIMATAVAIGLAKEDAPDALIYAAPGVLFVLGVVLLAAAALVRAPDSDGDDGVEAAPVPGGTRLVGCWLGRRRVACGILRVEPPRGGILDESGITALVDRRLVRLAPAERGSRALYDTLASLILDALTAASTQSGTVEPIASIGVGTPGVVDIPTGNLTLTVTVREADVPGELARRLLARDRTCVESAFGVQLNEHTLGQRIFVDNDVRCVARSELSKHPGWRTFACLYAGSGIGAALVFDGRLHFGQHGSAGHIGHIGLGADGAPLPLRSGHVLPPVRCDCGGRDFHLDSIANFSGLQAIAQAVAVDRFADVLPILRRAAAEATTADDDFAEDVFPRLVGAAGGSGRAELPTPLSELLDDAVVVDYLDAVLTAYVGVLALVLGMLVTFGDFGRVVLCGPLIESLRANSAFDQTLREVLPRHVFGGHSPTRTSAVTSEGVWRGAALLAWDPAYHREHGLAR